MDRFRGVAAGCLHSILLFNDGQLLVMGEAWAFKESSNNLIKAYQGIRNLWDEFVLV